MHNPFKYGKQVSADQFYDRQEISDDLYRMLSEGSANVVMYVPRRYGKTSLVLKVLERFGADCVPSIHFDCDFHIAGLGFAGKDLGGDKVNEG